MSQADVPSPIDLRQMDDAQAWEQAAMQRPFRIEFFDAFANELNKIVKPKLSVLELGSGPGFLASHLLSNLPHLQMTLLDSSLAMHELASQRLTNALDRVTFIERSFKEAEWTKGISEFDAVITNQAVHELRHKRYATTLHKQVRPLLKELGIYLVCDHYFGEGGMQNDQLYMSLDE